MKTNRLPNAYKAIITSYKGPTDKTGSRIIAKCDGGRVSIPYPHDANEGAPAHYVAAKKLADKLGWEGDLIAACMPNGADYVFMFVPDEYSQAVDAVIETRHAMRRGENSGNPHCRKFGKMVDALTEGDYAPFSNLYESQKPDE